MTLFPKWLRLKKTKKEKNLHKKYLHEKQELLDDQDNSIANLYRDTQEGLVEKSHWQKRLEDINLTYSDRHFELDSRREDGLNWRYLDD